MMAARGARRVFTDADLAYPVAEIDTMLRELDGGADVAIACRVLPQSRYLMSPSFFHYLYTRHVLSRLFNRVVRIALLPGILDTQAGLKAFTARAAQLIFPRLTVAGFGFDVELLYIARKHGLEVRQAAVPDRSDDEPSTVRFAADAAAMLRDLARIRWNDWRRGAPRRPPLGWEHRRFRAVARWGRGHPGGARPGGGGVRLPLRERARLGAGGRRGPPPRRRG